MTSESRLRGIVYMLIGVAVLALMDAALKMLVEHYPPLQVATLRGLAALPFVLAGVWRARAFDTLLRVRWPLHIFRGVLALFVLGGFIYALQDLSIADAYCLFFIAPLLIAALSVPLLHERVDSMRWLAIGLGLLGVLVMLRPTGEHFISWGSLAILLAALGYALSAITVRVLARTDSTYAMTFWFTTFLTLFAGTFAVFNWVPVQWADWPWLLVVGLSGAVGQHCITEAFRYAQASLVASYEYSALLWGVLLDYVLWMALPNWPMLAGSLIVIGSGLLLIWREQHMARSEAAKSAKSANAADLAQA